MQFQEEINSFNYQKILCFKNGKKIYKGLIKEEIEKLFDCIDENETGNIEYEELLRSLSDKEKLLNK